MPLGQEYIKKKRLAQAKKREGVSGFLETPRGEKYSHQHFLLAAIERQAAVLKEKGGTGLEGDWKELSGKIKKG